MKYNPIKPSSHDISASHIYNPFITTKEEPPHHEPLKKARSIVSSKSLSALFTKTRSKRSNTTTSRKRRSLTLSSHQPSSSVSITSMMNYKLPDQEEFSFSSDYNTTVGSDVSSELESLPDLTDDEYTPDNTPIRQVPNSYFTTILEPPPTFELQKLQQLAIQEKIQPIVESPSPSIFEIPEIVHKIIGYVDGQNTVLPLESTPIRRKPLSYKHALLIHGNKEMARNSLNDGQPQEKEEDEFLHSMSTSSLFNCLLVNKLFYRITSEIMSRKFYAHEEHQLQKFINNQGPSTIQLQPKIFILHKLFQTKQYVFDQLIKFMNFQGLVWFELYMCPKILPPISIFKQCGSQLKKLIITGSRIVDDEFVNQVSKYCPNLEVIDLRACELVSDFGLYQLSNNCVNLKMINLGRKNRGHFITDTSISKIIDNNRNLNTIGLAGCYITDKILWELAYKLPNLSRLSLNNCPHVSNNSISHIFSNPRFFTKLSVLELRFNLQLTDLKSLIEFKRRQSYHYNIILLLELCENLMFKLRQQELEMDKLISEKIFQDISDWANDYNDGDLLYQEIIRLTRKN